MPAAQPEPEEMLSSLYEDWERRRARLVEREKDSDGFPQQIYSGHIRVFDYLLERYHDSPAVDHPARFPLHVETYFNHRAIIVNHHLGRDRQDPIQTESEAKERVRSVLKRLKGHHQKGAPLVEAHAAEKRVTTPRFSPTQLEHSAWNYYHGQRMLRRPIAIALSRTLVRSRYLSVEMRDDLTRYLENLDQDDPFVADMLLRAKNAFVLDLAVRIWKTRLSAGRGDKVTAALGDGFLRKRFRHDAAEHLREALADDGPYVRRAAAERLSEIGSLDDVGLLSDLLAMPPMDDEAEGERDGLLSALQRLSRIT